MLFPKNKCDQLAAELFQNPTAEYRGMPFWSWNCLITEDLINRQAEIFRKMGFGGAHLHPRIGMETPYLSKEYMKMIQYTVKRFKELGLYSWLYDDDRCPSGTADGFVTGINPDFAGRTLLLTERYQLDSVDNNKTYILPNYCHNKDEFDKAFFDGKKPIGYYMTAYSITLKDGFLCKYRELLDYAAIQQAIYNGERVRFVYVKTLQRLPRFADESFVDVMSRPAMAEFIRITHEKYLQAVGAEFGKSIPAIFTDEPTLYGNHIISYGESNDDIELPYTEGLNELYLERYGVSMWNILPEFIWDLPDDRYSEHRHHLHDITAECFATAFLDQISDWCGEHNLALTGHVLGEDSLASQTTCLSDCMRLYRKMQIPGMDLLIDMRAFLTAKQVQSVVNQYGKEAALSELYGVTHWYCDFKTYKLQGDWQAALGITLRVPHLSFMSMEGEAKRDWPASIFYQSSWYEEYAMIENHFARLNTALSRGRNLATIAVIHPIESYWLHYGSYYNNGLRLEDMDKDFSDLIDWLLFGLLDFDLINESLLPELLGTPGYPMQLGQMSYTTIVVPGLTIIRSTTLDALEAFVKNGGRLVFMGSVPSLVDVKPSNRVSLLAAQSIIIEKSRTALLSRMEPERVIDIRGGAGYGQNKMPDKGSPRADNLLYQLREDGSRKWVFLCHVRRKNNDIYAPELYWIQLKGEYKITQYNTDTGDSHPIPANIFEGNTLFYYGLYSEDSLLLCLESCSDTVSSRFPGVLPVSYEHQGRIADPVAYKRHEPNALLLDTPRWCLDGGELHPPTEILLLDDILRDEMGLSRRRGGTVEQTWMLPDEPATRELTLIYEFCSDIEVDAMLAIERPHECTIVFNGKTIDGIPVGFFVDEFIKTIQLPRLKVGRNELKVIIPFRPRTNLEALYILGDFGVELAGRNMIIRSSQASITCGDITRQGMPMYTGALDYVFEYDFAEAGNYYVHVPRFEAAVLGVYVNGTRTGTIAYAPHRASLGLLEAGKHEIIIRVYCTRFNAFGNLHNANDETVWHGYYAYRTRDDDWSDSYCNLRPSGLISGIEIERVQS